MKTCQVVFNTSDELVEELIQYAKSSRLKKVFRSNRNEDSSSIETIFRGYVNVTPYQYKTHLTDLKPGDRVVVQTKNSYALATFIGYIDILGDVTPKSYEYKYVVSSVDFTTFHEILQQEEKRELLLSKMEQRQKDYEKVNVFNMLAEKDPEMKAMLEEYNNIK